jgi:Legionella pneumophila major outer membrane protein precursor
MKKTKLLMLGISMLLAIATNVFAIPQDPCAPKDVCCEEPSPGPFAFSYSKDVGLACPRNFYAHGEFLWMKGSEEGLEYAMDNDSTAIGAPNVFPLVNGKIKSFSRESDEWDWSPGFRVGLGFFALHDYWNFQADWTYIRFKSDSEVNNGGTGFLLPLFYPALANPTNDHINLTNASARWSGDYSTFDIMCGKPYHVSRYYVSNPMFGIRASWIDQDYLIRYYQNNNSKRIVHAKNDFWGVGLRGYYEGQFLLGSGWALYGKTAFAILFGKFDLTQNSDNPTQSVISPNNLIYEYDTAECFYRVLPNAEVSMGIAWSNFMDNNKYLVTLKIGYEFHYWWKQNQMRRFFSSDPVSSKRVSRGDLAFNGFMFGLNIDL